MLRFFLRGGIYWSNILDMDNILQNGRKTIAIAVGSLVSAYHENIMRGAVDRAEELGFNVVTFATGPYKNPDKLAQAREQLLDIIDPSLFDGIIIPISSHTRYLDDSERDKVIERFSSLPIINVGSILDKTINIVVNYREGLSELMDLLVNKYGYTNIALFRGPEHHASSITREEIYRELLKKFNLPIDDKLIITTDLRKSAAKSALDKLFNNTDKKIDAIVTCNDNLALGILGELSIRNISVPGDIAVIGSMDNTLSSFSFPPLTTIKEPMYELGSMAVELLVDIFSDKEVPKINTVPTSLKVRQSCGHKEKEESSHMFYDDDLQSIKNTFKSMLLKNRCTSCIPQLEAFITTLGIAFDKFDYMPFIIQVRAIFDTVMTNNDIIGWLRITNELKHILIDKITADENTSFFGEFLHKLERTLERYEILSIKFKSYEMDIYINYFKDIILNINHSFDIETVKSFSLQMINLEDFYVSIFDKNDISRATNIMAVRYNYPHSYINNRVEFSSKELIPQHLPAYNDRYTLLVLPLSYRQVALGFLTVNLNQINGSAYENMQVIISTALKNEIQIDELVTAEKKLQEYKEHLVELVKERTIELENSLNELKMTQDLLIESEKMASLGALVAGVAHELNTPIGICITSTSHLSNYTEEIEEVLESNRLSKRDLQKYFSSAKDSTDITIRNLEKTASIISEFKQVAADQTSEERREFDIAEYISNLIETYYPQSKLGHYQLAFKRKIEHIRMTSYPGVISPILSSLISNSIGHGFKNRDEGVITVELNQENNDVVIIISDDGVGIPPENMKKIFDPFFTTARDRGDHGLGLNVIYNMIRKTLKGTIKCRSIIDGVTGTEFIVRIPIINK